MRPSGQLFALQKSLTGPFSVNDVVNAAAAIQSAGVSVFATIKSAIEELKPSAGSVVNPEAPPQRSTFFEY